MLPQNQQAPQDGASASADGKKPAIDLTGVDRTVLGTAVREQLSPRSKSRFFVEATSDVGMFGHRFTSDQPGRPSVQIHPYPWTAAGSTVIPVFKNEHGATHIALVHNKRKDGAKLIYRLPEGFIHPKGCPDLPDGLPHTHDHNDEAEVDISFKGAKNEEAYATHPPLEATAPDKSLEETAIRELAEETGVKGVTEDQLTYVGTHEQDGSIHVIANYYLADLNPNFPEADIPPELTSDDPDEIDAIVWMQPREIEAIHSTATATKYVLGDYEIPEKYAKYLGHGLHVLRQKELCDVAGATVGDYESFFALVNGFIEDDVSLQSLLKLHDSSSHLAELGEAAELRHQQLLAVANAYRARTEGKKLFQVQPFKAAELTAMIEAVVLPELSVASASTLSSSGF